MKTYWRVIVLQLIIFNILLINAQQLSTSYIPDVKSPEAHSFQKYGNIGPKLYSGALDLDIPLTSIDVGNLSIPISLSYDSSGFIPHKKSDAAGLGWSLIGGGRIVRSLNGTPDEYEGTNGKDAYMLNPYGEEIDKHGFLKGVRMNPPTTNVAAYNLNSGPGHIDGFDWVLGSLPNIYEGEPDEFSFQAMGLSGKFVIGNDGNVLVQSDDPNIVVDISQMAMYGGSKFCEPPQSTIIITNGQGTRYIFGGDFSRYELSYSYSITPDYPNAFFEGHPMISSFSLSKIIFSDGKEIDFDYVLDTFTSRSSFCHFSDWFSLWQNGLILSMESYTTESGLSTSWQQCVGLNCYGNTGGNFRERTSFSMVKKSVLKSIRFYDEEIKINYQDTGYPIRHFNLSPFYSNRLFNEWVVDNIELYHKNQLVKKKQLVYAHLGGEHKRPFLTTLRDEMTNEKYMFEYYKTDKLPPYYTKGIDHWGYWNGKDTNTSLTPLPTTSTYNSITGDYTLEDTFRDPNPQNCNVALLKKIVYPTGGISFFDYEPHMYEKRIERTSMSNFLPILKDNQGISGGARVKRIISISDDGTSKSNKEYRYGTDVNDSSSGGISSGTLMHWPRYFYNVVSANDYGTSNLIKITSSNIQRTSLDSYNVGYSNVYEVEEGKGYKAYQFSSYENFPDIFAMGEPKIKQFNFSWTNFQPLNLFKNYSNLYPIDFSPMRGRLIYEASYSQQDPYNPIKVTEYEYTNNTGFNPASQIDNNNYVTVQHISGYWVQAYKKFMNSSVLKSKTESDFFSGNEKRTFTEYLYDSPNHLNLSRKKVQVYGSDKLETLYKYSKDITGLSELTNKNFTSIPLIITTKKNDIFTSKSKIDYSNNWLGHSNLLPYKESFVINPNKIDTNEEVFEERISYDQYDNKGNLLQYTIKSDPTTIIYGYNRSLPIAKIRGAKYLSVINSLGQTSDLQNYHLLDICQKSDLDGDKASGLDEGEFLSSLDNFRKTTAFSNYQITTYTYDPLLGIRSITLPNGNRESYKYVSNRLDKIYNIDGSILKEFSYGYSDKKWYYNTEKKGSFRNANCGANSVSDPVIFTVPAFKYSSDISQDHADSKAVDDLYYNGQILANTIGTCQPLSCPVTFNSAVALSGTSSVYSINSEGRYMLTLSFITTPDSNDLPWEFGDPGVKIATIGGSCKPIGELVSGGTQQADGSMVMWTVYHDGSIYIDNTPAPGNNKSVTWNLEIGFN
ncbi:DUF5977 domain-containing protein [Epilithonimonas zeae]|uniref:DUF5977 domain-containing protein n=1 Tax=Epilithonimonas zeae TaxID=1416779 RepID=UPI00200FA646|nr:DUF5977 domain-containing protein [Epilithonimonas zeae]UQB69788.1 hypothetical protein KI430_05010 [Epilithonimonas zeae]